MDQLTRRCSPVEWRVLRGDTGVRYCRGVIMIESSDLRMMRMPLNHGDGHIPVLGFGTLIPDAAATISATRDALGASFRHFDCAERYRNEREVSMPAAVIQASMPCLTQMGMATVRMRRPLPSRSAGPTFL